MTTPRLLLLELNEVNFDFVRFYAKAGKLPAFSRLIRDHGVVQTRSERQFEHLEPWIQWVTAHTGKTFSEHGVFRLGDIVHTDHSQIWEMLEARGFRVGAVSPMNAKMRLRDPAFFLPDPWTQTGVSASAPLQRLYRAVCQAVGGNAEGRITMTSAASLVEGLMRFSRVANWPLYGQLAATSSSAPWRRAMFLDVLLADVFIKCVRRTQPDFATLFLNAAAHIQHHYMFCAEAYQGAHRNPSWYVSPGSDPVLEVYALYDRIISQVLETFPRTRLMLATGLHQEPHDALTYYWRLRDHAAFLRQAGLRFASVTPLMSRDFCISFDSIADRQETCRALRASLVDGSTPAFEVDERAADVFVMFVFPNEITATTSYTLGSRNDEPLADHVAFVAVKNGEHHDVGYFVDTGAAPHAAATEFDLAEMPDRILAAVA